MPALQTKMNESVNVAAHRQEHVLQSTAPVSGGLQQGAQPWHHLVLTEAQQHTSKEAAAVGAKKELQDQMRLQRVSFHCVLYSPLQIHLKLFTPIKDKYVGNFSSCKIFTAAPFMVKSQLW